MTKFRRAAKVDSNQAEIVKALRQIPGVSVALRHDDILVGFKGRTYWYEIKAGAKAEVKAGQAMLRHTWSGHYAIVSSIEHILVEIGATRAGDPYLP